MKNFAPRLIAGFAFSLLCVSPATAQPSTAQGEFSLQGQLTTGLSNQTIADGQYNLTITVYEAGTQNAVLTETDAVMVTNGIFSTMVGDDAELSLTAGMDYEVGVSLDGGAELTPRIMLGSAPKAITADIAANAQMLGGMSVSSAGGANRIVATNANGRLDAQLLNNSLNITGSGVSVDTEGGTLNLEITGGTGNFELPFTDSADVGTGESAFSLTAMGAGSAATFLNSGTGSALSLSSNNSGSAALDITNNGGTAINAVGTADAGTILRVQNTSTEDGATLIAAMNAEGDAAFEVMENGRTVINSTAANALEVTTSAAGEAALKITGGLMLNGPVGQATLPAGTTSVTVDNDLVTDNSIILLTINSTTSLTNGLRLSGQEDGSFTVSLLDTALGGLNGGVDFNYLIINTATP